MKVKLKGLTALLCSAILFGCSLVPSEREMVSGAETRTVSVNHPPSVHPPQGLQPSQVPQFLSFGFKSNGDPASVKSISDLFSLRTNPGVAGNSTTYDQTSVSATFICETGIAQSYGGPQLKEAWIDAWNNGHELAVSGHATADKSSYTTSQWRMDIDQSLNYLTDAAGISPALRIPLREDIFGFGAGSGYNSELYTVLKEMGLYDNSIEEGFQYTMTGDKFLWPYTLDNGSPGHDVMVEWGVQQPLIPAPGVWEMPIYTVVVPPALRETMKLRQNWFDTYSGKITGTDYNLWSTFKMTKDEFLATMKYTLDQRLAGNRAPFIFRGMPELYTGARSYSITSSNYTERYQALSEFLDYALSKNVVRVVSVKKTRDWILNPFSPYVREFTVTPSAGLNGTIEPSVPVVVKEGGRVEFTLKADTGYYPEAVYVDGISMPFNGDKFVLGYVEKDTAVNVTFKRLITYPLSLNYARTYSIFDEPVDLNVPDVDILDVQGNVIARIPETLAERVSLEGQGVIPDRRIVRVVNNLSWPQSRFEVVDTNAAPWGLSCDDQVLEPFETVFMNGFTAPAGNRVFLPEFDGVTLGGKIRDGWFTVATSYGGVHPGDVVVFTGDLVQHHEAVLHRVPGSIVDVAGDITTPDYVTVQINVGPGGTVSPSGSVKVRKGGDAAFTVTADAGYTPEAVLANGVAVALNGDQFLLERVDTDTTVNVSFKLKETHPLNLGYAWTYNPEHEPVDLNTPIVDMLDIQGNVIASVPEALAIRLSYECQGFLPDGRLVRLANHSSWPGSRFELVDQLTAPWGLSDDNQVLEPFEFVFMNGFTAPVGSRVYLSKFDGVTLGGMVRDGWFTVARSYGGEHPDSVVVFTGDRIQYQEAASHQAPGTVVHVSGDLNVVEYVTVYVSAGPGGSVYPSGPVTVRKGSDAVISMTPDERYVVSGVTVDGVHAEYSGSPFALRNVQKDCSVNVSFEILPPVGCEPLYTIEQDWGTGFSASVLLKNNSAEAVQHWTVILEYAGNQKVSGWNGIFTQNGNIVTITNTAWNGTINPGQSVKIGINGNYSGVNDIPTVTAQ